MLPADTFEIVLQLSNFFFLQEWACSGETENITENIFFSDVSSGFSIEHNKNAK